MGLLDALFQNDSGGGLFGGLPSSWQYQNPQDELDKKRPQIQYDQLGNVISGAPEAPSPFGALPQSGPSPYAPPSVFASGAGSIAPNPNMMPPQNGAPPASPPPAQNATPPQPAPRGGPINTMNVGGAPMPQFGSAADYTPNPAAIPQNAQPAQGQLPSAPQQFPPALGGNSSGGNLGAGLNNFANSRGLLPAIAGGITGLMTGQRTDPLGMQQQSQAASFKAFVEAGMPPNVAMAAALNPKLLEQVGPGYFSKNEIVDGGTDPLTGKKTFVLKNTVDGKVTELNSRGGTSGGNDAGGAQDVADSIAQAKAKGATREQLLQLVPSSYRPYVDAVLQDKALPANMGRGAARMQVMGLAHAVDDKFNEEMIPTRLAMRKDFAGEGRNGQAIGSFNTAQHHIDKLSDDLEGLSKFNGNFPSLNAARGWLANNANTNPQLRDTMQSVNTDMAAVSHEVGNAYNAGHLSDHDMAIWNKLTSTDLPPDQLRRGISDFVDLLNGKRDSLNHMYHQTFGEDAPSIEQDKNAATTAKVHQRSPDYTKSASSSTNTTKTGVSWSVVK